jgi:hypothetical protein
VSRFSAIDPFLNIYENLKEKTGSSFIVQRKEGKYNKSCLIKKKTQGWLHPVTKAGNTKGYNQIRAGATGSEKVFG